ncbi:MAG: hypothetical protein D6705_14790 [Deltaproteobacteria bacterium]|nr:MAG: hypothetical protein D6705_14790 [Deltaproteobacteria bacterium]
MTRRHRIARRLLPLIGAVGLYAGCKMPEHAARPRVDDVGACPARSGPRVCFAEGAGAEVAVGIVYSDRKGEAHVGRILSGECYVFPPAAAGAWVRLDRPGKGARRLRLRAGIRHVVALDGRVRALRCGP